MAQPTFSQRQVARCAVVVAIAALAATYATAANAGCGSWAPTDASPPAVRTIPMPARAGLMDAVYRPGAEQFVRVRDDGDMHDDAGIVGTWRFTFVSDGTSYPVMIPYGAVVDFGTVQWHADGTEFMISGGRPPSSGDVCMGSWEQTGPSTYRLKHIALAWASSDSMPSASPAVYVGPAIIREVVTLNHARNAFEGSFTLDQYAKDEVTLLQHISGKVTATRFSAH